MHASRRFRLALDVMFWQWFIAVALVSASAVYLANSVAVWRGLREAKPVRDAPDVLAQNRPR